MEGAEIFDWRHPGGGQEYPPTTRTHRGRLFDGERLVKRLYAVPDGRH